MSEDWKQIKSDVNQGSGIAMGLAVKWWMLVGVLVLITGGIALVLKPAWLGFERKIFVASHQYQEAHRTALATLQEKKAELAVKVAETNDPDVKNALRSQMAAIQRRIETEERKLNQ